MSGGESSDPEIAVPLGGGEHCDLAPAVGLAGKRRSEPELAVRVGRGEGEERGGRRSRPADIKSNKPHMTAGEIEQ